MKRKLNARLEYAKFLQGTVKEMAKEVQNSRSGEIRKTAEDLDEFMNKVSSYDFSSFIKRGLFSFKFRLLYLTLYFLLNRLEKVSVFLMMIY